MHFSLKKKMKEWVFRIAAFVLLCVMVLYVFYAFRYLLQISQEALGDKEGSSRLIERFDFATLEQVLRSRNIPLP